MRRKLIFLRSGLLLVVLTLLVQVTPVIAAGNANPGVLPPNSHPYGKTYSEWSAAWWQWAFSIKVHDPNAPNGFYHPLVDTTGLQCGVGQTGQVWFLGGVYNNSGSATRTCRVPSGKALYFPIVNIEDENCFPTPRTPGLTAPELRQEAKPYMDSGTDIRAEIDGVSVKNLDSDNSPYRINSTVFSVTVPDDNLSAYANGVTTPAQTCYPMIDDGYYLMVAPLSNGNHTLHFHGTIVDFGNFTVDITYYLVIG